MNLHFSRFHDITLPIYPGMTVYPNNPKVKFQTVTGATSISTKLTFGSHTGTHLDAPRHVFPNGKGIDSVNLQTLIGPCRVLDMTHCPQAITITDLEAQQIKSGERILLKTKNSSRGWDHFYPDYIYLDGDAADFLVKLKILLLGIDYFSIKQKGSNDIRPHTSILKAQIPIIEAVDLSQVQPGKYFLIALPLKLKDLDGSPARVLLLN